MKNINLLEFFSNIYSGLGAYTPTGAKALAYTDQPWTADLKELLHEIHDA